MKARRLQPKWVIGLVALGTSTGCVSAVESEAPNRELAAHRTAAGAGDLDGTPGTVVPVLREQPSGDLDTDVSQGLAALATPLIDALPPTAEIVRGPNPTLASASTNGPYLVRNYTSGYRNGAFFADATVYYPTNADAPFALVAVVPGFFSPQLLIQGWGPFLASHGMVVITIGTNSVLDAPAARRTALLDALESLAAENTRLLSPLANKLDTSRRAVMGWSMGGGGALQAANENATLKAAIGLASWHVGYVPLFNSVPTLLFASFGDALAGGQSQGFYNGTPARTPKMLIEWPTADHFVANSPVNMSGTVGRYGLSWLKVFLEGDERYRQFLKQAPSGTSDFRSANL